MKIIPFVHEGLGNSSYVVDLGNGEAILVDPDRSVRRYLEVIEARGLKVAGVLETHLHADFVSGSREIGYHSGARSLAAAAAHLRVPHLPVEGGQTVTLGGAEITIIGSPGHTPEHVSYVMRTASSPPLLFSGGSLIVGGAARTDLISPEMTETLSRAQFRTLHQAFSVLPDETLLLPTHGGGSFCSTGASGERASTLGQERRDNPLLAMRDEDEFVTWFPTTFPAVPDYFFRLRAVNQAGPRFRSEIAMPGPLEPASFAEQIHSAVVIDARSKEDYARGHISGALNNTLRDDFAVWLGWLVPAGAHLLFVTEEASVERLVDESLLVGYEDFAGWLKGGMAAWERTGMQVSAIDLAGAVQAKDYLMQGAVALDVREPDEYAAGHIPDAVHIPLGRLAQSIDRVPSGRPVVVYCGHGERASTAASILEDAGFRDLVNLDGGIGAWEEAGLGISTKE